MKHFTLLFFCLCLCVPTLALPDGPVYLNAVEKTYLLALNSHTQKMSDCFGKVAALGQADKLSAPDGKRMMLTTLKEMQTDAQDGRKFDAPLRFRPAQEQYSAAMARYEDAAQGMIAALNAPPGKPTDKDALARYAQEVDGGNVLWNLAFDLIKIIAHHNPDPSSGLPPLELPSFSQDTSPLIVSPLVPSITPPEAVPEHKAIVDAAASQAALALEGAYCTKFAVHMRKMSGILWRFYVLAQSPQLNDDGWKGEIKSVLKEMRAAAKEGQALTVPPRLAEVQPLYSMAMGQYEDFAKGETELIDAGDEKAMGYYNDRLDIAHSLLEIATARLETLTRQTALDRGGKP